MLALLNKQLENDTSELTDHNWREWLWKCDINAALCPRFNRFHLLGYLLARHKAKHESQITSVRIGELMTNMIHASKKISDLSLRQFRDVTEDLQMHWKEHSRHHTIVDLMDGLFAKFGMLLQSSSVTHDDMASVNPNTPTRMNDAAMRRFVVLFGVLYRHLDLEASATTLDTPPIQMDIQQYHMQAALDAFNEQAMHVDIPPGSRAIYKLDFAGMYHSISQVVYFHFPNYARKRQISIEDVKRGIQQFYCLSVAMELRPDIIVILEDELRPAAWHWILLSGGAVYLSSDDGTVYNADCIWNLLTLSEQNMEKKNKPSHLNVGIC